MSDRPYLTAQLDVLNAMLKGVEHLKSIASNPNGNADDYDYSFASYCSDLSDLSEFSISTKGFSALTDTSIGSFMHNLCSRTANVFNAPYARLCFGGSSQSMLMLVGKILPGRVKDKRRTIAMVDVQGHQASLGGIELGHWDMVKLDRKHFPLLGVSAPLTLETVKAAADANGTEKIAALIYNPISYDGFRNRAEERKIFEYCRRNGILVICDFAWSPAYSLYQNAEEPISLLDYCDSCCCSPHKKGLFNSSVSVLLFKEPAMAEQVTEAGRLGWMTTSPSYGLLQLVDYRLAKIESGEAIQALNDVVEISQNLRHWFNQLSPHMYCVKPSDVGADYQCPSHLLLSSGKSGIDCRKIGKWLSENALTDVEKTTKQTCLYLVSQTHKPLQSRLIGDLAEAISVLKTSGKEFS